MRAVPASCSLALAFVAAACVTPYQRAEPDGVGYSEIRLEQRRVRVSFRATARTGTAAVRRFLLRRCAEVTLETGHDWFTVDLGMAASETVGEGATCEGGICVAQTSNEVHAATDLHLGRGDPPAGALDARQVLERGVDVAPAFGDPRRSRATAPGRATPVTSPGR